MSLIVGACGRRFDIKAMQSHMTTCHTCLAWWFSNTPKKAERKRAKT